MAKKKSKSTTKKKPAKKDTKALAKKEYTEEEKARIAKYEERKKRKSVKVEIRKSDSGEAQVAQAEPGSQLYEAKMLEALGTPDSDLQNRLLDQVIQTVKGTVSDGVLDKDKVVSAYNHTMAILSGIQPQDELEAMLAVQMIGVHNVAMETLQRAMLSGQTFEGKQVNVNQATKMLRTYVAQMEALKKYRTGGQQKMVVEHVHVNEGGQAIVGNVNQGGEGKSKNNE